MLLKNMKCFLSVILVFSISISLLTFPMNVYSASGTSGNNIDYNDMFNNEMALDGYGFYSTDNEKITFTDAVDRTADKAELVMDVNIGVLQYSVNTDLKNKTAILSIPLEPISVSDGCFTIETKLKMPVQTSARRTRGIFSLSDGTNINIFGLSVLSENEAYGLAINANNRGDGAWTYKQLDGKDFSSSSTTNNLSDTSKRFFISAKTPVYTENYYTYKWVVYPFNNTFKFSYSTDDGVTWIRPYENVCMMNPSTEQRYTTADLFPTGTLPETINSLLIRTYCTSNDADKEFTYNIAYIKVNQEKLELENAEDLTVDDDKTIVLDFNSAISADSLNAITVKKNGSLLVSNMDYTISRASNDEFEDVVNIELNEALTEEDGIIVSISKALNEQDGYSKLENDIEVSCINPKMDKFYVAVNGDDNNPGTLDLPLKTISKAMEKVLEVTALNSEVQPTIYLRKGEYSVDETIVLDSQYTDITFSNYKNEKVSINAGYSLGTGELASASDLGGKLPEDLIEDKKIYKWDISAYKELFSEEKIRDYDRNNTELVDGDELQTVARWPEEGYAYTGKIIGATCDATSFEFVTSAPVSEMTLDNAYSRGYFSREYRLTAGKISKGDLANTVKIDVETVNESEESINTNRRYYLYNIPEELDSPGEYYIDYDEGFLYYYPKNSDNMNLQLTGLRDGIFNIQQDCDNVTFKGIEFKNTRGNFIKGSNCDYITIEDCVFKNSGGRGVYINNTYNTNIKKSGFYNIGDSAVELIGGDQVSLSNSNSNIQNCYFENGGRISGTYAPFIQLGEVKDDISIGINVENNYFYNHKHSAIIFEGNDFIIKNNIFDSCCTETQDAGVIYSRANPTYRGNKITNNIFRNLKSYITDKEKTNMFAVYADDLLPDLDITENVFYNCEEVINLGGGQSHNFSNNLVYDCIRLGTYKERWNQEEELKKLKDDGEEGYLYNNIKHLKNNTNYNPEKWYERYHDFETFVTDLDAYTEDNTNKAAVRLKNTEFENNIMIAHNASESNVNIKNDSVNLRKDFDWFADLQTYTDEGYTVDDGYGINYAGKNYYSKDLEEISIDGVDITDYRADKSKDLPDVSYAGIQEPSDLFEMPTGTEGNGKALNSSIYSFEGYKYENFASYDDGTSISDTTVLDLSGNYTIQSGLVSLNSGDSITANLHSYLEDEFVIGLKLRGSVDVYAGGTKLGTLTSDSLSYNEIRVDDSTVEIYNPEKNGRTLVKTDDSVTCPSEIYNIKFVAIGETDIQIIAMSRNADNTYYQEIIYYDFEDMETDTSPQDCDNKLYAYGVHGGLESIIEDDNGNKAISLASIPTDSDTSRYDKLEFAFTPIKLAGNVTDVYFKVKCIQKTLNLSGLRFCMIPVGFDSSAPNRQIHIETLVGYYDRNDFRDTIQSKNAYQDLGLKSGSDYIDIKYTINGIDNTYTVYKKNDGEWIGIFNYQCNEDNKFSLPEYIDRLKCTLHTNTAVTGEYGSKYLFDDIRVVQRKHALFKNQSGEFCEPMAGETVTVNPDYIPGKTGNVMFIAIKNSDKTLDKCKVIELGESTQISLPNSTDANIEIYSFEDILSISPMREVQRYSIK